MKNCSKCGAINIDEALFCAECGQTFPAVETPAAPAAPAAQPKNPSTLWLVLNIILTVLCGGTCLTAITGIIGIVMAAMGSSAFGKGNYAECDSKVKVAKIMFIVGLVVALIGMILSILYLVLIGGFGALMGIMESM